MSNSAFSAADLSNAAIEALLNQGKIDQVAERCEARLQAGPNDPAAWFYLAHVCMKQGDIQSAIQFLNSCLELDSRNVAALRTKAEIASALGDDQLLQGALNDLFKHYKNDPVGLNLLGLMYKRKGELVFARNTFSICCRDHPNYVPPWVNLARCHQNLGEWDKAMGAYNKALTLSPGNSVAISERASLLDELGRSDEALGILKEQVERNPASISVAISYINIAVRQKKADEALPALERLTQKPLKGRNDRLIVGFAGAQLHDSLGNYDKAFEFLNTALSNSNRPYDPGLSEAVSASISSNFPKPVAVTAPEDDKKRPTPIFVVGMPRSGTSLTEQLLGRSDQVRKGGERRELGLAAYHLGLMNQEGLYLKSADLSEQDVRKGRDIYFENLSEDQKDRPFLVDKLPSNIFNLGLARQLFPDAKLILCKRDPRDVSLSCLMQNFSEGAAFSFDQEAMGHYYGCYQRLEDHWRSYFGEQLYVLDYANLVSDLESELPRVFAHCGLEVDDSMLSREGSKDKVATASYHQTRQAIYQSSVERWRPYEEHLGPLISALEKAGVPLP
ncbi:tetratricopeptide repeat-containing sulfotransferase family protein [Rhodovibrionaceae bacterium A322]